MAPIKDGGGYAGVRSNKFNQQRRRRRRARRAREGQGWDGERGLKDPNSSGPPACQTQTDRSPLASRLSHPRCPLRTALGPWPSRPGATEVAAHADQTRRRPLQSDLVPIAPTSMSKEKGKAKAMRKNGKTMEHSVQGATRKETTHLSQVLQDALLDATLLEVCSRTLDHLLDDRAIDVTNSVVRHLDCRPIMGGLNGPQEEATPRANSAWRAVTTAALVLVFSGCRSRCRTLSS